ncbi:Uncharacterised protein [Klebsiella aerogenes]|nr:Uncharacterised protein [Klebsiella aerogenes]
MALRLPGLRVLSGLRTGSPDKAWTPSSGKSHYGRVPNSQLCWVQRRACSLRVKPRPWRSETHIRPSRSSSCSLNSGFSHSKCSQPWLQRVGGGEMQVHLHGKVRSQLATVLRARSHYFQERGDPTDARGIRLHEVAGVAGGSTAHVRGSWSASRRWQSAYPARRPAARGLRRHRHPAAPQSRSD